MGPFGPLPVAWRSEGHYKRGMANKKKRQLNEQEAPHRKLLQWMRGKIQSGQWPSGTVVPSRRQLAIDLDVSPKAIRLALEQLRVEGAVVSQGNRRLKVSETSPRRMDPNRLVLIVHNRPLDAVHRIRVYDQIQRGIEQGASTLGLPLLTLHDHRYKSELPRAYLKFGFPIAGILVVAPLRDEILQRYEKLTIPVVLVDQPGDRFRIHSVCAENVESAYKATRRLLEMGHRRIAFQRRILTHYRDVDPDAKNRQQGFQRAMREEGFKAKDTLILNLLSKDGPDSPNIQRLFKTRPLPTAVFCSDGGGAGLLREAGRAHGISIPEDLSVICFQDEDSRSEKFFSGPVVSGLKLGRRAVELLSVPASTPRHDRLSPEWASNSSMAPPQ